MFAARKFEQKTSSEEYYQLDKVFKLSSTNKIGIAKPGSIFYKYRESMEK